MTLFRNLGFVSIPVSPESPRASARFRLSESSRCFDGHFEGAPILPGVVHVALALAAYAHDKATAPVLTGLRDLRFMRPLGPGDEVEVQLTGRGPASVQFDISVRGERATTGLLLFRADNEASGE